MLLTFVFLLGITAVLSDKIGALPGYNGPAYSQYSGYINIDTDNNQNVFYWLIESPNNPTTKPLVVWFNGGPGCSSMIGLFSENGPYVPNLQGGLDHNPINWVDAANMLYVDQPSGVGFSFANSDVSDDVKSAEDNFKFLEAWLQQFSQYKGRPLWITGESYGGVYIPSLFNQIANHPNSQSFSQFAGAMIGNPVFNCDDNEDALTFNLLYYHGLVSFELKAQWDNNQCDSKTDNDDTCSGIVDTALDQVGVINQELKRDDSNQPSVDPDNLYQDFCTGNGTLDFAVNTGWPDGCNPVGLRMATYLNRKDVQAALGVNQQWQACSPIDYTPFGNSTLPLYQNLFNKIPTAKVLVYSGDVDILTCPFPDAQRCMYKLQSNVTIPWQPWFVNGATAGYVEVHAQFTYATVKGAGHEVPQYQPLTGFNLFQRFLNGQSIVGEAPAKRVSKNIRQGDVLRMLRGWN